MITLMGLILAHHLEDDMQVQIAQPHMPLSLCYRCVFQSSLLSLTIMPRSSYRLVIVPYAVDRCPFYQNSVDMMISLPTMGSLGRSS
jgi:hypothetical protein